jgi:hypothetical protein
MAIPRGYRFAIEFDSAFPQGLVLVGEVAPDNEAYAKRSLKKWSARTVRKAVV